MIPIYEGSAKKAIEKDELDLWRESHRENIRCKEAIEKTISDHFDGMHLDHDIHLPVIDEFGIDRVNRVLATTLTYLNHDGRFSHRNKEWAAGFNVRIEDGHSNEYVVRSHPAVLDGFTDMVRKYNELNMADEMTGDPDEDTGMAIQ